MLPSNFSNVICDMAGSSENPNVYVSIEGKSYLKPRRPVSMTGVVANGERRLGSYSALLL